MAAIKVTRYLPQLKFGIDSGNGFYAEMDPAPAGDWVKFSDYKKLLNHCRLEQRKTERFIKIISKSIGPS